MAFDRFANPPRDTVTTKYETPVGGLRYRGRRSGRLTAPPVAMNRVDDSVVVRIGLAATKAWWRTSGHRMTDPISSRRFP